MKNGTNFKTLVALEREREREIERELYFSKIWSKGGSREHRDVVILPRNNK